MKDKKKIKRNILSCFTAAVIVFGFGTADMAEFKWNNSVYPIVKAAGVLHSGTCGETAFWSIDSDGTLTVSGIGKMSFGVNKIPWKNYRDLVLKVVIEDGIENINDYAFYYFKKLTEVQIADSVEDIGYGAFYGCFYLEKINIPPKVTRIKDSTFNSCISLSSVTFPENLKSVGRSAFENCSSLREISFPDTLKLICSKAFQNCDNLKNVVIPEKIEGIGSYAFRSTEWFRRQMNEDLLLIVNDILVDGYFASGDVVIPDSVTRISPFAFDCGYDVKNLIIPDSIKILPYNLTGNKKNIIINGKKGSEAEKYAKAAGLLFFDYGSSENEKKSSDQNNQNHRIIDSGKCGENAFWVLDDSWTLTISGTGKTDEYDMLEGLYNDSAGYSYDRSAIDTPWYVYSDFICKVVIEDGIQSVGSHSFHSCTSLSEVSFPDSVTTMGNGIFFYCTSLLSVRLSENLSSLENESFKYCSSLKKITIPDGLKEIGYFAFQDCTELKEIKIPESVAVIHWGAFNETVWIKERKKESPLVIVNDILIDGTACKGNVDIPYGVKRISQCAFIGNKNMTSVRIPNSVKKIEIQVFEWNNAIIIYGRKGSAAEKYAKDNDMIFFDDFVMMGDIDNDGVVSCMDLNILVKYILSSDNEELNNIRSVCDFNDDDCVDIIDLIWLKYLLIGDMVSA